jgi:drug/metabolite transporter (DMT)-like permease
MRSIIGRVAAVVAGLVITAIAGFLNIEVTADARVALTEGLTMLGAFIWLIAYAVVHKLINRRLNPSDTAA